MQAARGTSLNIAPKTGRLTTVLLVATLVVVLDQFVKWFMVESREGRPPIVVVGDLLRIAVIRNAGAAFGVGGGVTVVFSLIALVVVVVVVRQARTMTSTAWAIALGGLLGGAVGNLIDRLFRAPGFGRGAVVDFVDVKYFSVFNLADAALTLSALAIVVLAVRGVPISTVDDEASSPEPPDAPGADGGRPYSTP